jgi:hypothetical protein
MVDGVKSVNGVLIRLTAERWLHIIEQHTELTESYEEILKAISQPERVLAGHDGEKMAVYPVEDGKWLIVVYREFEKDGFIITAFFTRRYRSLEKRVVLWLQSSNS